MPSKYRIRDWSKHYEISRDARPVKTMIWVPLRTDLQDERYLELVDHPDGPLHFAAWVSILQIAARSKVHGEISPSCADLPQFCARLAHFPRSVFEGAIPRLIKIGWIEEIQQDTQDVAESAQNPRRTSANPVNKTVDIDIDSNTDSTHTQCARANDEVVPTDRSGWNKLQFREELKKIWKGPATQIDIGCTEAMHICDDSKDPPAAAEQLLASSHSWAFFYRAKGCHRNLPDWLKTGEYLSDAPQIRGEMPIPRHPIPEPRYVSSAAYDELTPQEIEKFELENGNGRPH